MVALITLDEAKQRLRIDFNDDDADYDAMAEQATGIVIGYIKKPDHEWTAETVPHHIKAAVLIVFGRLDAARAGEIEGGIINQTVRDLLHRDRDPALA